MHFVHLHWSAKKLGQFSRELVFPLSPFFQQVQVELTRKTKIASQRQHEHGILMTGWHQKMSRNIFETSKNDSL
jgi:hypothetical protein